MYVGIALLFVIGYIIIMDYRPDILERIDTLSKKCFDKKKIILDYIGVL
jgi:hypothetical protein